MNRKALAVAAVVPALGLALATPAFAADSPRPARVNISQNVTIDPSNASTATATVKLRCDGGGIGRWGVTVFKQLQQPGYPLVSFYSYDSFYGANAIPCDNVERSVTIAVPKVSGEDLHVDEQVAVYVQIHPANEAGDSITKSATVRDQNI